MERLTRIAETGDAYYPKCFEKPCCGWKGCLDSECELLSEACKKLAEYEQLEEQGLLVRLPVNKNISTHSLTKRLTMSVPTFEIDNIKTPNICINHDFDITPQLAISAFSVLQQYCNAISSHECITCAFYSVCEDFFTRCPGDQDEVIRKLQSNE